MKTPIFDFVKEYNASGGVRLHMPGHKGKSFLGCEELDITEIRGADVLYSPDGIIAQSEDYTTELFGSAHTYYSAEGSSLAIKAMLALAGQGWEEKPLVLSARNVHKAFVYACALLDYDVEWIYSDSSEHFCSCEITPQNVEKALASCDRKPCAVYITSPDYLGKIADVKGIADVCKLFSVPLLVDNAHGAYLAFMKPSIHPIALGAAMCCDSAHKTLPVLTGGAYLHISKDYGHYRENARQSLSLFASTSPSYLILQSLDLCNKYLASGYKEKLVSCIARIDKFKASIKSKGFFCESSEPLKAVINAPKSGYTGDELADELRKFGIEPEFSDGQYLVFMFTPENTSEDFERLEKAFSSVEIKLSFELQSFALNTKPEARLTVRQAVFSPSEKVKSAVSVGRICASPCVSCPPAVPIVVSGEIITREAAELFARFGIEEIEVVK